MAGPLWTTTYVGKENTLASLDWANPKPNWELITHARVINDRRDDFATPVGAFKTLHFWNREPDEKKKTVSKGFDLVTCRMDEDGNVVDEKKFLVLNDAAFVMAGSSSGLAGLLLNDPGGRSVERIGAGGAAELTQPTAPTAVAANTNVPRHGGPAVFASAAPPSTTSPSGGSGPDAYDAALST